jgi:hypothetical protein
MPVRLTCGQAVARGAAVWPPNVCGGSKVMKPTLKLAIRRETLRALAQLDLARVVGGNPGAQQLGTEGPETGCPFAVVVVSQPKQ